MTSTVATRVLELATAPALVFASPPSDDDASVLDLRATDLPTSDVMLRNEARRRWRAQPRLVVRVDDEPSAQINCLLLELARREVRLSALDVDTFDASHSLVVRVAAKAPPAGLVRFFPIRLRAPSSIAASAPAARPTDGRANARRR